MWLLFLMVMYFDLAVGTLKTLKNEEKKFRNEKCKETKLRKKTRPRYDVIV